MSAITIEDKELNGHASLGSRLIDVMMMIKLFKP